MGPGNVQTRKASATRVLHGRFVFLNHEELLSRIDWHRRHFNPLWTYNLHYFDYALDLAWASEVTGSDDYADRFTTLALDWIEATAKVRGVGWEPYPLSTRILNWIQAIAICGARIDPVTRDALAQSIHAQAAFLEKRLEWHLLANHIQRNLCALIAASCLFAGPRASRWRERGKRGLCEQMAEQILGDGGHFERTPMYHAVFLGDVLVTAALLRAVGDEPGEEAVARIQRMADALPFLSRPDGSLHLFNDSASGIADGVTVLLEKTRYLLGLGAWPQRAGSAWALPETGYFGFYNALSGERLIIDCGQPGAEYQPGHAHCDLLSYELDVAGVQVVVDSGVRGYDGDSLREYTRSTRAHNTVMIGGMEQSEVWGTFRVARRARPVFARGEVGVNGAYVFSGGYTPYHSQRAIHSRTFRFEPGCLTVTDRVEGFHGKLQSFIHLHPEFSTEIAGGQVVARRGEISILIECSGIARMEVVRGAESPPQGWYCPEFGRSLAQSVVIMHAFASGSCDFGYTIRRAPGNA